jgi:hypothetical protein
MEAAKAGRLDAARDYVAPQPDEITVGHTEDGRAALAVHASPVDADIPRVRLVRTDGRWVADAAAGPITPGAITL